MPKRWPGLNEVRIKSHRQTVTVFLFSVTDTLHAGSDVLEWDFSGQVLCTDFHTWCVTVLVFAGTDTLHAGGVQERNFGGQVLAERRLLQLRAAHWNSCHSHLPQVSRELSFAMTFITATFLSYPTVTCELWSSTDSRILSINTKLYGEHSFSYIAQELDSLS